MYDYQKSAEAVLIRRAKRGDVKAFSELYSRIYVELYKFALYTLKHPQEAEDAVSDTVKAAKYRIFFLSEDNEKISNENSYVADSREENAQKRIFRMRFTFKNKKYDKDKQYYLVVYDEESGLEQWRQPVIMDIAFADDFGFGF